MDVIFSASIIAAFIAGMVALFAPCCITVLLPAYLASTFREKRHVLRMTFVFFAGIAVVLVPIGLGAAALAQVFRDFHKELYIVGGLLMLLLAGLSISGKGITMIPMPKRKAPKTGSSHVMSVFSLGVFSGAATSCCAPVLAGAVTLAVISGAFWKAIIVTFAYVFGMTFPLFVAAYFYDKLNLSSIKIMHGRIFNIPTANFISGAVFLVMGIILLVLAFYGNAYWAPEFQVGIGEALQRWSQSVLDVLMNISDIIWGFLLFVVFFAFFLKARKR